MEDTPVIAFSSEQTTYITPSWDHMHALAFAISERIRSDGRSFDRLVTLAKGGWALSLSLVDCLSLKQVASIGVRFYSGINTRFPKPQIYQELPVSVKGEHVILFDDVVDTGESMVFVKKHLEKLGVSSVTTASLYVKPHTIYTPDYFGEKTTSWIVFPYDTREFIEFKGKEWEKRGMARKEILRRFTTLHFSPEQVSAYFS